MTTFCWLPPDRAETGASSEGALTDSESQRAADLVDLALAAEQERASRKRRSAETAAFSRTDRLIIRPSASRSAGM